MTGFKKYPKIEQFRNVCYEINKIAPFGEKKPKINFHGSVKIHGTNGGIRYDVKTGKITAQKRSSDVFKGGFGFPEWVKSQEENLRAFFQEDISYFEEDFDSVILFGEWAGPGIQKGVGISEINEKRFFVFEIHLIQGEDKEVYSGINPHHRVEGMFFIKEFPTFTLEIDFNAPESVIETLGDYTTKVEQECPVASYFGVKGVGEGVVWKGFYRGKLYRFKVKGEKHSVSKVKTLAPVDMEAIEKVQEFIDYSVTQNRLSQGFDLLSEENDFVSIKLMGKFLSWVAGDVLSEEMDVIEKNGLDIKAVKKEVAKAASLWFKKKLEKTL